MHPDEYRKMAEVEDHMWYYRALHRNVVESLKPRLPTQEVSLLDAGCGTGGLLRRLHQAYPHWRLTGLDFSPVACELARERTQVSVEQGSITELPFANETYDVAVSCDVICQVPDDLRAVREVHRCLRPGGIFVITMPAYQWMYSYHDREVSNLRRYSRGQLKRLLAAGGFETVCSTYWNMLPFPLAVVRRKIFPPAAGKSDVKTYAGFSEVMLNSLMRVEHGWLSGGGRMPFGTSVLAVARKPFRIDPHARHEPSP